jgi:Cft2 family RNA processing exonuclease
MIQIGETRISLDRREAGADFDFISHAHSDHVAAAKSSNAVVSSDQTGQLVECAYGVKTSRVGLPENMRLLDAGHMLGSKQLYVETPTGARVVYTGDFNLGTNKTARPIEMIGCDFLIMDSTYYGPEFNFGDKVAAQSKMVEWVKGRLERGSIIFSAYKMGKAQELISIFNDAGIVPIVSDKVGNISKVYQYNGVDLKYGTLEDNRENESNFVGITENRNFSAFSSVLARLRGIPVYTAMASGFAKVWKMGTDMQFVVSDHADFSQSLEYIKAAGARRIYTYGQSAKLFADNLCKEGYSAEPLPENKRFD